MMSVLARQFVDARTGKVTIRRGKVKVKINAPSNANPNVNASGENILPSTFWKEKMGKSEVMIISFEKKIAFPSPVPVCFIQPAFAILLKRSIPYL